MMINLSTDGEILDTTPTSFSGDLSGVAYDSELDLLWVLSDVSERVFLTDISGRNIFDYWDLPVENPEGIVINNDVTPPTMYIVTDPSSPGGKQYVPAMFAFTKPVEGTGLSYYNKHDPSPPKVECNGCDDVWKAVDKAYHKNDANVTTIVLASVLPPVGLGLLFLLLIFILVLGILIYKKKSSILDEEEMNLTENEENYFQTSSIDGDIEIIFDEDRTSLWERIMCWKNSNYSLLPTDDL